MRYHIFTILSIRYFLYDTFTYRGTRHSGHGWNHLHSFVRCVLWSCRRVRDRKTKKLRHSKRRRAEFQSIRCFLSYWYCLLVDLLAFLQRSDGGRWRRRTAADHGQHGHGSVLLLHDDICRFFPSEQEA